MKVLNAIRRLWKREKKQEEGPISIVLLLREFHFFTREELEQAAERGWGKRFDGDEDPMYLVSQTGAVTFVKAGSDVMNVLHAKRPYLERVPDAMKELPQQEQRQAVLDHNAWVAIDSLASKGSKREQYAALARLALQLGNQNCCAVYLPGRNILAPNDGTAEQLLHMLMRNEVIR